MRLARMLLVEIFKAFWHLATSLRWCWRSPKASLVLMKFLGCLPRVNIVQETRKKKGDQDIRWAVLDCQAKMFQEFWEEGSVLLLRWLRWRCKVCTSSLGKPKIYFVEIIHQVWPIFRKTQENRMRSPEGDSYPKYPGVHCSLMEQWWLNKGMMVPRWSGTWVEASRILLEKAEAWWRAPSNDHEGPKG